MSKKTKLALIFGGRSAEHEISLLSASAIHKNLSPKKFDVISIYINKKGLWKTVPAPSTDLKQLEKGSFGRFLPWQREKLVRKIEADIYFPVLHGPFGEDGTIQGLLEMAGLAYVGSGITASALGMDKSLSKTIWQANGLPVVPFFTIKESSWRNEPELVLRKIKQKFRLPLFIKPSGLGSSVGITKVKSHSELTPAIEKAFSYDGKLLVEKAIDGREIECSVLGNENPEASLPGEVIPYREFYDYADKYLEGKTKFVIPVRLPGRLTAKVRRLAVAAFRTIDCSGYARVDFFLDQKAGKIYLSEINTIPGFTEISMFPRLWEASGLSFSRLLERLVELGFERHSKRSVCVEWNR